jgi:hypothetical protein
VMTARPMSVAVVEPSPLPAFTATAANAVLAELAEGVPLDTALTAQGIDVGAMKLLMSVIEGRKKAPDGLVIPEAFKAELTDFADRARVVLAACEAKIARQVYRASQQANEKTGLVEWRAGAWLLNNAPTTRARWHEHRELTVHDNHENNGADQLRLAQQMSDQELLEAAPAEWRELWVETPALGLAQEPTS